jgi:hypothetical protein
MAIPRAGGYGCGKRIVALFRSPLPEQLQGIDPAVVDRFGGTGAGWPLPVDRR